MAKIAVCLLVAALALHASAAYHYKQKMLGVCDQKVRIVTTTPEPDQFMKFELLTHGLLVKQTLETCSASSCELTTKQLFRPDLATGDNAAKEFAWQPATDRLGDPAQCAGFQVTVDEAINMYIPIEGDFDNREIALFHGIKCFKYTNDGEDGALYGDDATGAFYGLDMEGIRYAYNFTPAIHTPETFTFNSTEQAECEPEAFKAPPTVVYEKECENLPTFKPVDFVFQSRFIRAISHKLRAHKHL